jgi:hypothetical protein
MAGVAVDGLLAEEGHLHVADLVDGCCQGPGRAQCVGAGQRRIGDQNGIGAAHRQAGLQRFVARRVADAQGDGVLVRAAIFLEA